MSNNFLATDQFLAKLVVIDKVATTLSLPEALKTDQLPVTNAVSCASVVLLSGYFESYLKGIVEEYIKKVNQLGQPISSIPQNMRHKHYSGGVDALLWATKRDKKLKSTSFSEDLTRRLGSLQNNTGYELAWESFANTKSNPGTETVSDILNGLEVEKTWNEINGLVNQHGRLDTFLSSFIEMRNVCAHTGLHQTPPTAADIFGYVDRFKVVAECIDLLIGIQLEKIQNATV